MARSRREPARSHALFAVASLLAMATLACGCSSLGGIAYLLAPEDVPAECASLKGKHVAVVCRPVVELAYSDAESSRELARLVGDSLKKNVRRCRIIGDQEVARWLDENDWVDYPTLGKSVDADIVVGIDLEEFRLHEGSTLLKGRASIRIRAFDVTEQKVVFEKRIDDFSYPAQGAIPSSDCPESQFRATFLKLISQRIARCFHAHDSREYFAEENLTF
jgi:hypothetical protein